MLDGNKSVPRVGGRLAQCRDGGDDAEPGVGSVLVALRSHRLDHLSRLGQRRIAVKLNPLVRGSGYVEV